MACSTGVTFDDVKPVLHAMTENVLLEIHKTFDFFKASATSDRIDRIFLCGGAASVDGFADALEARFDAPVEMFDPFKKIEFDLRKAGMPHSELTSTVAVAVGLALRKAGDR